MELHYYARPSLDVRTNNAITVINKITYKFVLLEMYQINFQVCQRSGPYLLTLVPHSSATLSDTDTAAILLGSVQIILTGF